MNRRGFFGLIGSMILGSVVVAKAKTSNMVRFPSGNLKRRDTVEVPSDRITATDVIDANRMFYERANNLHDIMGKNLTKRLDEQIIKALKSS